jgi:cellulose synthase/poly-beta-1,6-N-acetylglucosamine synthase-like glycosyltransferase
MWKTCSSNTRMFTNAQTRSQIPPMTTFWLKESKVRSKYMFWAPASSRSQKLRGRYAGLQIQTSCPWARHEGVWGIGSRSPCILILGHRGESLSSPPGLLLFFLSVFILCTLFRFFYFYSVPMLFHAFFVILSPYLHDLFIIVSLFFSMSFISLTLLFSAC